MPVQLLPRLAVGAGSLPRYGGGWQHQFSHVNCLQREMLQPSRSDWFRACELWHTARQEGVALNIAHYQRLSSQLVREAKWEQALAMLGCMRRQAVRPDADVLASVAAACVEAGRLSETVLVVEYHAETLKLRQNDQLRAVLHEARARGEALKLDMSTVEQSEAPPEESSADDDGREAVLVPAARQSPKQRR